MSISKQVYCEIIAQETPKVTRNCHQCKQSTAFYSSDKFRVNAQQKSIDVWLIYKCVHCDSTWNYSILSRVHPDRMDSELHQRFMSNDRNTAWMYAFQIEQLRKVCSSVNMDIAYQVIRDEIHWDSEDIIIHVNFKYYFDLRLDKMLREILCVPRSKLYQMAEQAALHVSPPIPLKSKMKEVMQISIQLKHV
jgi:hypothetical protein